MARSLAQRSLGVHFGQAFPFRPAFWHEFVRGVLPCPRSLGMSRCSLVLVRGVLAESVGAQMVCNRMAFTMLRLVRVRSPCRSGMSCAGARTHGLSATGRLESLISFSPPVMRFGMPSCQRHNWRNALVTLSGQPGALVDAIHFWRSPFGECAPRPPMR